VKPNSLGSANQGTYAAKSMHGYALQQGKSLLMKFQLDTEKQEKH
jgi:hypothetical protein